MSTVPKGCRTISVTEFITAINVAKHVYAYVQYAPDGHGEYINVQKSKARALDLAEDAQFNVLWMHGDLFIGGRV